MPDKFSSSRDVLIQNDALAEAAQFDESVLGLPVRTTHVPNIPDTAGDQPVSKAAAEIPAAKLELYEKLVATAPGVELKALQRYLTHP